MSSGTQWYPRVQSQPRSWLLTNGEVITEPPLEQTSTGLKIRVTGTKQSFYSRDLDKMILAAVDERAQARGTSRWIPLDGADEDQVNTVNLDKAEAKSDLYLLRPGDEPRHRGVTQYWWTFRHPTLPISTTLTLKAWATNGSHYVQTLLSVPDTRVTDRMYADHLAVHDDRFSTLASRCEGYRFEEHMRDNEWEGGVALGSESFISERAAVQCLLERMDAIEALDNIPIPNLREFDQGVVDWLWLDLHDTNFSGSARVAVTDFLSAASSIDDVISIYEELRGAMKRLGINMSSKTPNDFQRALETDEKDSLRVSLGNATGEAGSIHQVDVHLHTGTFVVTCPHADRNEVALAWDEARVLASLTGQEDALLAYANEYGRSKDEKRARKVLRQRMKEVGAD